MALAAKLFVRFGRLRIPYMSKIGRKPIDLSDVQVDINGQEIRYAGKKESGVYMLPVSLEAELSNGFLRLVPSRIVTFSPKEKRDINRVWGLHHALLQNKIFGAKQNFELLLQINGLGYKAVLASSDKLVFSLGYSHKIDFNLPVGVSAEVDGKTGQRLILRSSDNVVLGQSASRIRALRPPEPYKGTGVKFASEVLRRKAGKTKSS